MCFKQQLRSIAQRNKTYQALAAQTEGQFIVGLRLFMEFGDNKNDGIFSALFFFFVLNQRLISRKQKTFGDSIGE